MPAFTLIELLIVMAIIGILVTAVFFASTTLINRAKTRKTQFALKIVNDALEEFRREAPSIITAGKGRYLSRYGKYPPDELEPFTDAGIPGCAPPCGPLIPGGAAVIPKPSSDYPAMLFYTNANAEPEFEHRDIAAMILGIQIFGDQSSAILSDIPEDHWVDGPVDVAGVPLQYLDRDNDGKWDPTEGDEQIRYIVDAWRVPLGYFNQRDHDHADHAATKSSNSADWNEGATEMIALNKGKPIVMSYGPDGREQLTKDAMVSPEETPPASLIGDFEDNHRVDHRLNQDNIYADPELKRKLATGIAEDEG